MRNYLFIGSSSKIVDQYINENNLINARYYGVSSKVKSISYQGGVSIYGYENINLLKDIKFDVIIILASRLPWEDVSFSKYIDVNNQVEHLLKSLSSINLIRARVIFLSSLSVYKENEIEINENSPIDRKGNYVISKLKMEQSLMSLSKMLGFELLILRIPVFAYIGGSTSFISRLIIEAKNKSVFTLTNKHSFLSAIFDIEHLIIIERSNWHGYSVVNCGAVPDITFNEIGQLACKNGLRYVKWEDNNRISQTINIDKISKILGFKPSSIGIVTKIFNQEFL